MSEILTKIKKKINFQYGLNRQIEEINYILSQKKTLLDDKEIDELTQEKYNLESQIIKSKLSFEDKFNDFIYTFEDINEAKNTEWLIQNVLPSQSIGVFFGNSGAGKTALILNFCIKMLKNSEDIYIIYIDADMSISKLKEIGIDELIQEYKNRFFYAGKSVKLVEKTQTFLQEVVELQKNNKTRKYIVIEDSLTLLSPKKNGFIDTNLLYKYEKQIREAGGTVVIIHHLNKSGIFADSQQIENFADYTFLVERNEFPDFVAGSPKAF